MARIILTHEGYGIEWNGEIRKVFPTVTEAQMFCVANFIPFEAWR